MATGEVDSPFVSWKSENVCLLEYVFPRQRLALERVRKGEKNIVLVACGSFNPPTRAHTAMFHTARRLIEEVHVLAFF